MYNVLEDLYVFFSQSGKKNSLLKCQLQKVENALKLRNLSKTRCVYRYKSIEAMWRSFEALKDALAVMKSMECGTSTTRKAFSLLKKTLNLISYVL